MELLEVRFKSNYFVECPPTCDKVIERMVSVGILRIK